MRYITRTAKETQRIAARLATKISKQRLGRRAVIIGLVGDLGSGKTTFIQGFARSLGIRRHIVSPTFTIMRRYKIPRPKTASRTKNSHYPLSITSYQHLIHVDAYRVHKPKELKIINFKNWLENPAAIVLIEWADLIEKKLVRGAKVVHFAHGRADTRIISMVR